MEDRTADACSPLPMTAVAHTVPVTVEPDCEEEKKEFESNEFQPFLTCLSTSSSRIDASLSYLDITPKSKNEGIHLYSFSALKFFKIERKGQGTARIRTCRSPSFGTFKCPVGSE